MGNTNRRALHQRGRLRAILPGLLYPTRSAYKDVMRPLLLQFLPRLAVHVCRYFPNKCLGEDAVCGSPIILGDVKKVLSGTEYDNLL
jgi:hypothetical protein